MQIHNQGKLINGVKLKKSELLQVLKDNLEKHRADVIEAVKLRRERVMTVFTDQINAMSIDADHELAEVFKFPLPEDNSRDYEKAIRMIEMTQYEFIELEEDQFDKLVMDNWHWKRELALTSALYGKVM